MKLLHSWVPAICTVALVGFAGCTLITSVDRSEIDEPNADASTGGTAGTEGGIGGGGTGGGGTGGTEGGIGGGGTGGTAGSGGTEGGVGGTEGGVGGSEGGVTCTVPTDCPPPPNECIERTCVSGLCGVQNVSAGTVLTTQTAGDCQQAQCDGAGAVQNVNDDSDTPDDQNDCTTDTCNAGVPANTPVSQGTACGTGGSLVCDNAGNCVGCNAPTDCAGTDDECKTRTCVSNVCGVNFTAAGTALTAQTAGDCQKDVCDGSGNTTAENDDNDLPDDNNVCTDDVCTSGTPSNPPLASGTSCGTNLTCDGNGACVGCTTATDCPGTTTECATVACLTGGVCGFTFTAQGTVLTAQTAGDCNQDQCDGAGGIQQVALDSDLPVDGLECTQDVCTSGTPSNPPVTSGTACTQNGGTKCNGLGACVACLVPADCGTDTDCATNTCTAGVCGVSFTASGTPTSSQTSGDCKQSVCDGSGGVTTQNDNTDVPVDGKECTSDVCTAGTPSNPPLSSGTACTQGGTQCDGAGNCVGCIANSDCGTDDECKTFTCASGSCQVSFTASGTAVSSQTSGDCKQAVCDGAGNVINQNDDTDLPVDNKQCTGDVCTSGTPSNPNLSSGTACTEGGGIKCDGSGNCVACLAASDCGSSTECKIFSCSSNTCGSSNTASGTPVSSQTAGDCKTNVCDGSGGFTTQNDDTDLPVDGNQCTQDVCTAGTPSNPNAALGTSCNQGGGSVCNGSGNCVQCNVNADCATQTGGACSGNICQAPTCGDGIQNQTETDVDCGGTSGCNPCAPTKMCGVNADCQTGVCNSGTCGSLAVVSTTPADAATGVAVASTVAITFTAAMNGTTLTAQATPGACSGSVQVSTDDFVTCIGLTGLALSAGDTVATFTPSPGLSFGSTYKIRVTTAAQDAFGNPLGAQYTSTTGFTTNAPPSCDGPVVISYVYGGGGNSGSFYTHDFIELHNRSNTAVDLTGWAVQYASASGTTWQLTALTGSIAAGGYYLVQQAAQGGGTQPLPTPDAIGAIPMSGTAGKVALTTNAVALTTACPTTDPVIDIVGFGSGSCATNTPTLSATTGARRLGSGCTDTNDNSADFAIVTVDATNAPRNTASAAVACSPTCGTNNEASASVEADFCNLQFPTSLTVAPSTLTPLIFGRIFESGVTEAAGAPVGVTAQVGFGPATVNPTTQSGWQFFSAVYNTQVGNDDEFQGTFTTPATTGSYRYTYRFSLDGKSWTYCDLNGAGSNSGLSFEVTQLPTLTVQ